jgi:hypothetical protein
MVTPLNAPREVRVAADEHNIPAFVWISGRQRRVVHIRNTWRIDDEWWRQEIARRYFDLELGNGSVTTVFQDLMSGKWYQQRY